MTTPPAHAAQTVDVSRDAVEKAIAMLRALLDAKEKAERDLTIERARQENQRLTCKCGNFQSSGGLSVICKNCGGVMP